MELPKAILVKEPAAPVTVVCVYVVKLPYIVTVVSPKFGHVTALLLSPIPILLSGTT